MRHLHRRFKENSHVRKNFKQSVSETTIIFIAILVLLMVTNCATQRDAKTDSMKQPATADTHADQGDDFFSKGKFAEAINAWETAVELYREENNRGGQCTGHLKLAEAYQSIGLSKKALENLEVAGVVAQEIEEPVKMASVSNQLGSHYLGIGKLDKASRHLNDALVISRKIGNTGLKANILNNLGNLYSAQQDFLQAILIYEESISLSNQNGDTTLALLATINCARATISSAQPEKTQTLLRNAYATIQTLNDSHTKSSASINVGLIYRDLQPHLPESADKLVLFALQSFEAAEEVAERINDARASTYALGYQGNVHEDILNYPKALQYTNRALHAAQQFNMPEALFQWQWQAGRIHKSTGEIDRAIEAFRAAIATLQSLKNEQTGCYDQFNAPIRNTIEVVSIELVDLLLKRAAQCDDLEKQQIDLFEARDVVELRKVFELRNYFHDDCVDTARSGITRLDDVSATAVVVYPIILDDRVEVLASFPGGLKRFTAAVNAETVAEKVRELRLLLEKRTTRQFLRPARQLYDWLILPLASDLAAADVDTLVFVPDGSLRTIPMAALHDGQHFLVEDFAVAITPGLDLTEPKPIAAQSYQVLMLALTQPAQEFPALPYVSSELESIQMQYPSKLLLNEDFQVQKMEMALKDQQYGILHIASHAQFEADATENFILAYDGRVSINNLREYIGLLQFRDRPLELLTLSACETAAGDDKAALGLAGIAIKAGARSALASLWHINDFATSLLIGEFYRRLTDLSGSKAKALQSAQLKLINDSRFQHPGYWAPFILINNWL
jgi:CHAT domain-containing protein/Tfp pilus assembly protein PilF